MLNRNRITALILCALMLSQTLASCGSSDDSSQDTTLPVTTQPEETGYEVYHDLGELDFEGKQFNLWTLAKDASLMMEEETGDVSDDAAYARNRTVEEQLNIDFNVVNGGYSHSGTDQAAGAAFIQQNILSGDTTYHAFHHVQHGKMPGLVNEGCFVDWNTIPNVDLTKPYWYQGCINDINYGSKIYVLTGAYTLGVMAEANCMFFNKRLLDEAQVEYPYQLVLDGKWTYDKWIKMIEDTTKDLDGDTKIDPKVDQTGYWGWGWEQPFALFIGMGGDIVVKDSKNLPVASVVNERNIEIVDKINKLFAMDGAAIEFSDYDSFRNAFKSGRLAFMHGALGWATNTLRDMEDDFGFIPHPKLDEKQDNYNVRIGNTANMTYIPVTNAELDFTGAVLEVLAAESYNKTIPAYFDVALTVKTTRDTESELMVPVLLESTSFFDSAVTGFDLCGLIRNSTALSTYYAGVQSKVEDDIKTMIETFSE